MFQRIFLTKIDLMKQMQEEGKALMPKIFNTYGGHALLGDTIKLKLCLSIRKNAIHHNSYPLNLPKTVD